MEANVHTYTPASLGFMQLVPGSFKPYPCPYCESDTGFSHAINCPTVQEKMLPCPKGEQCGRCWQNHTPGFVCACVCHETDEERDFRLYPGNGDDLDAPTTS